MGRALNRLSAVAVNTGISRRGMHHDGGGLYLQVSAGGARSWIFRFTLDGRAREMGLGPVHAIPLAEARKRAAECRRMRVDKVDPIEARMRTAAGRSSKRPRRSPSRHAQRPISPPTTPAGGTRSTGSSGATR